jgi:hypothetical protein
MLSFAVGLHDHAINKFGPIHGPLFHRWLPNGKADAIRLSSDIPNSELQIWFERRGIVQRGKDTLVKYDYDGQAVEADLIRRQAILDAGPLRGLLTIRNIASETAEAIRTKRQGDKDYVDVGKQLVNLLHARISKVLAILRFNFGQYWIRELEPWDSRKNTLSAYCLTHLHMKCSLDNGMTWDEFLPDEPIAFATVTTFTPTQNTFTQYLTQPDWQQIADIANSDYQPSLAAMTLMRAHHYLDQGDIRQAFVEGVTALELAVSEVVDKRFKEKKEILNLLGGFWNLSLPARFATIATASESISVNDVELTVQAIKTRNKLVHENEDLSAKHLPELEVLLFSVAKLIPGATFKFPSANTGNNLSMPEQEWDQLSPGGAYYLRPYWMR